MARNTRKYPRVSSNFAVKYTVGEKAFRAQATTLGGGGLFLKGKDLPPEGTTLRLQFRAARHMPQMEAEGRVCYQIPGIGVAAEFTSILPQFRTMLLRLIHHKIADRRKFPRAPLVTQVECEEYTALAFSRDVSVGGLFVETKEVLPAETRLNLRFHLEDSGPIVVLAGEVKYAILKLGMGIQFVDVGPEDRKRIAAYVANSVVPVPEPVHS